MGLGRFGGGVGVARWLARQGARVTVTDLAPPEKLQRSLSELDDLPVTLRLGGHERRDFTECDLVVASPAVPRESAFLAAARDAGVPLTTEICLFAQRCPAPCVGITGSVGKSTIASMTAHVLERTLAGRTWLGGNIGVSLLDELPRIRADDRVVLELSSFQLEWLGELGWSPHVAVVAEVSPNHLDRHGSFAAYLAAKLNIVRHQDGLRDTAIVQDTSTLRRSFEALYGDLAGLWRYGLDGDTPTARRQSDPASDCDDLRLAWPELRLDPPGRHNRLNAAAALTVAHVLRADAQAGVAALASYRALPDRLQRVAACGGVEYYNDSKSTTPEAAVTAMDAIASPLLMIVGGYDKHIELSDLAARIAARARFAACIGQTGAALSAGISAAGGRCEVLPTLDAAVRACAALARPGDVVLLSPACASYDMFEDYRARGRAFTEAVRRLARGGDEAGGRGG